MSTTIYSPSKLGTAKFPGCDNQTPCDPTPACPACGGLHTLCRPRFFAGQLLTEADLNRLDRYITEKNRLHNRYLHGWGVACGLEVVCSVCQPDGNRGKVLVKPGYALSPCGNDIVVPNAVTVDVCELIQRCRPQTDPCFTPHSDEGCQDSQEDWILAICYQEQTAREVVALRAQPNCTEGKRPASDCGCGCGGQAAAGGQKPAVSTGANVSQAPQCEPTTVCETYAFRAYKVPKLNEYKRRDMGALVKRFVCCLVPFFEDLGSLPPQGASSAQLQLWLLSLKDALREFLRREGLYDCEVAQRLTEAEVPALSQHDYMGVWSSATINVLSIALLVVQKCFCAALLPPCPEPALDDCVPIATVSVGRNPCRVIKVCNVASRRFLLTWPNVHYWLSWLPLFGPATGSKTPHTLRDVLVQICCTSLLGEHFRLQAQEGFTAKYAMAAQPTALAQAVKMESFAQNQAAQSTFANLLESALRDHPAGADLGTLLLAAMDAPDANGRPLASELELGHPGEFVLMNQLVAPMLRTMLPLATTESASAVASAQEVAALREELAALNKLVESQASAINQLKKAGK